MGQTFVNSYVLFLTTVLFEMMIILMNMFSTLIVLLLTPPHSGILNSAVNNDTTAVDAIHNTKKKVEKQEQVGIEVYVPLRSIISRQLVN